MIFTESDLPDEIEFNNTYQHYSFTLIKRDDGYHLKNDIWKNWPHTPKWSILNMLNGSINEDTFGWWNKGIDKARKILIFKKQISAIAEGREDEV